MAAGGPSLLVTGALLPGKGCLRGDPNFLESPPGPGAIPVSHTLVPLKGISAGETAPPEPQLQGCTCRGLHLQICNTWELGGHSGPMQTDHAISRWGVELGGGGGGSVALARLPRRRRG